WGERKDCECSSATQTGQDSVPETRRRRQSAHCALRGEAAHLPIGSLWNRGLWRQHHQHSCQNPHQGKTNAIESSSEGQLRHRATSPVCRSVDECPRRLDSLGGTVAATLVRMLPPWDGVDG